MSLKARLRMGGKHLQTKENYQNRKKRRCTKKKPILICTNNHLRKAIFSCGWWITSAVLRKTWTAFILFPNQLQIVEKLKSIDKLEIT